jgi:hypothetical protein
MMMVYILKICSIELNMYFRGLYGIAIGEQK